MNTYKTDKYFQSKICNIRCDLEELAQYAREQWENDECLLPSTEDMDWQDVSDEIQDFADAIATNFETTEE